jgi:hypothetical protein
MLNNEELFERKLREVHKKIFSQTSPEIIFEELDILLEYSQKYFDEVEYFKKFTQIIDMLAKPKVLENQKYVDGFFKEYLNRYFDILKPDFFECYGLLFSKILKEKICISSVKIFVEIFKIIFPTLTKDFNDINFPLGTNVSLFQILKKTVPLIENALINSTSYNLFFNSKSRDKIAEFLFDYYKKNGKLSVWFPFSGLGIEPLMLSYIIHLFLENEKRITNPENFSFHCSDSNFNILEKGLESKNFEEYFIKIKNDFCKMSGINPKNVRTTIKNAGKKIVIYDKNLAVKNERIDKKVNFIFLNSSCFSYENTENFERIIDIISKYFPDVKIIMEIKKDFPLKIENFEINNLKHKEIIISEHVTKISDFHLNYVLFSIEKEFETKKEVFNFREFYKRHFEMTEDDLKKEIKNVKVEMFKTGLELLQFAEILSRAGLFSKSYEIIKKNFKSNYNKSYKILKKIIEKTKNSKLKLSAEKFMFNNKIIEKGFSAELLDGISEEIDKFYKKNSKQKNNEKWL